MNVKEKTKKDLIDFPERALTSRLSPRGMEVSYKV